MAGPLTVSSPAYRDLVPTLITAQLLHDAPHGFERLLECKAQQGGDEGDDQRQRAETDCQRDREADREDVELRRAAGEDTERQIGGEQGGDQGQRQL